MLWCPTTPTTTFAKARPQEPAQRTAVEPGSGSDSGLVCLEASCRMGCVAACQRRQLACPCWRTTLASGACHQRRVVAVRLAVPQSVFACTSRARSPSVLTRSTGGRRRPQRRAHGARSCPLLPHTTPRPPLPPCTLPGGIGRIGIMPGGIIPGGIMPGGIMPGGIIGRPGMGPYGPGMKPG